MKRQSEIDWNTVLGPELAGLLGGELHEIEDATSNHSRRCVRVRPDLSVDDLPFPTESVPWYETGRFLTSADTRPGAFLHHAAGDYYVQDAGSMLALAMCQVKPGQSVCDTCASPGGKSTALLEQLDGQGVLVSNEVIASRTAVLQSALSRTGYANYLVFNREVESLAEHCGSQFDCVVVDAPCTGQSMIARGKQTQSAYTAQTIAHCRLRQLRIMKAAARLVRPGGRLVYSTCTFSFEENEGVVGAFLREQAARWQLLDFPELKQWESPVASGCYRLWPHRDACAGAFAATLIKVSDAEETEPVESQSRRWDILSSAPAGIEFLHLDPSGIWAKAKDEVYLFPEWFDENWIAGAVSGLAFAKFKSDRWEPLYGSAKWRGGLAARSHVDLSDEDACKFVAGESFRIAEGGEPPGWQVAKWNGRALGWCKLAGRTVKNHFPKALRQQAVCR